MTRRAWTIITFCSLSEAPTVGAQSTFSTRLNILHIILDDFQLHPNLSGVTPNLDAFATSSTSFTHAYANAPICTASRSSFLSGRHPYRFGISGNIRDTVGGDSWTTLPGRFKQAGYAVMGLGKTWHPEKPADWDGALSWSEGELAAEAAASSAAAPPRNLQEMELEATNFDGEKKTQQHGKQLPGDALAQRVGYSYWPPSAEYDDYTTGPTHTRQCACAASRNGKGKAAPCPPQSRGGVSTTVPLPLPGSAGNVACWAAPGTGTHASSRNMEGSNGNSNDNSSSSSSSSSRSNGREDSDTDAGFDNNTGMYDAKLADRAIKLIHAVAADQLAGRALTEDARPTNELEQVPVLSRAPTAAARADSFGTGGSRIYQNRGRSRITKEEGSAAYKDVVPFYLVVGFHLPHTPWIVPKATWEEFSGSPTTFSTPPSPSTSYPPSSYGPAELAPQQVLPMGAPDLAGCAGKGCLPSVTYVSANGTLVTLRSPQEFGPKKPMPSEAHLIFSERGN